jgi:hypothetical protein
MDGSFRIGDRYEYEPISVGEYLEDKEESSHTPFTHYEEEFEDVVDFEESVEGEYPGVEVRLIGLHRGSSPIVDGVLLFYDGVDDKDDFEEWCRLRFKYWFREGEDVPEGADTNEEGFRSFDDALWCSPDEFDFRETVGGREYCRLWWD